MHCACCSGRTRGEPNPDTDHRPSNHPQAAVAVSVLGMQGPLLGSLLARAVNCTLSLAIRRTLLPSPIAIHNSQLFNNRKARELMVTRKEA
jgi:hypothetical protein